VIVTGAYGRWEALADVASAQEEFEQAREDRRDAVSKARAAGATWADIGRVLQITKQAAHEKFRDVI
jgi:hypothetical protein